MELSSNSFFIKNCALAAIATGESAGSLIELHDKLLTTHIGCIYFHFWGGHLHPEFVHPEYLNDFASWAHHCLHDLYLAERLSVIDPTDYENLEALRQKLLDTVEERMDENDMVHWTRKEHQFHFIRSKIIVFETPYRIETPHDLSKIILSLPPSSIFYHFIDARGRTADRRDDFSTWLSSFGGEYNDLIEKISSVDPYFFSLTDLRSNLAKVIEIYFEKKAEKEIEKYE